MDKPFLTVTDSFYISGLGTMVEPPLSPAAVGASGASKSAHVAQVRLLRPDGTEEIMVANFFWAHFNPGGYRFVCLLPGIKKEQVPPGTQMWQIEGA
ncbi:MAG: hypothetical protein M3347_01380 [Armatimonadota bacterium]|nr:hypothetical protein [Armatimonadota bacterium]